MRATDTGKAWAAVSGAFGGWTIALYCYSAASSSVAALVTATVAAVAALAGAVRFTGVTSDHAAKKALSLMAQYGGPEVRAQAESAGAAAPPTDNRVDIATLGAILVGFAVGTTAYAFCKERVNLLPPPTPLKATPTSTVEKTKI